MLISAVCPKCSPRESGPKFVRVPGGVTTSPTLLGPVLVWSQQNYIRLLLIARYSGVVDSEVFRLSPKEKRYENEKMNECVGLH